jgi:Fur family transcriptional regulator, ferric uptake regulator
MTSTHPAPPLIARDLDEAITVVRERGMRVSSARRLLLEALFEADGPMTADELAAASGQSDSASVYRNLDRLEAIGLVRHVHLGHGPGLYALAGSFAAGYVVCDRCGARQEASAADLEALRAVIRDRFSYEAAFSHFPIVGLCPRCSDPR